MGKIHFKEGQEWPRFEKANGARVPVVQVSPKTTDDDIMTVLTKYGYTNTGKVGFHRLPGSDHVVHAGKAENCPYCKRSTSRNPKVDTNVSKKADSDVVIPPASKPEEAATLAPVPSKELVAAVAVDSYKFEKHQKSIKSSVMFKRYPEFKETDSFTAIDPQGEVYRYEKKGESWIRGKSPIHKQPKKD